MKRLLFICLVGFGSIALGATPVQRPNILFITAEGISPNLGCYGGPS